MAILCGKHNLDKFTHLIQTDRPLALVGGGACDAADLALAKRRSSCFVAADGGADTLLAHDITAEAVIGDLDSITVQARSQMPPDRLHLVAEQNSTDFEKCLRHISAPLILGLGFTGGRIDHQMAVFHGLLRYCHQRCMLLGSEDVVFLAPPEMSLELPQQTRISLFPMGAVQGTSEGLFWPIDGLAFAPGQTIGTSNLTEGPVRLRLSAAQMLVILPRNCFEFAFEALLTTTSLWPEHNGVPVGC
jgi:thiamine pyrophosphokinase